jgi:uncharacterized membrane protein
LKAKYTNNYWSDQIKVLLFASTGMGVGVISMQLMHGLVARWKGWLTGWLFIATTSLLCSVGVGLGRFKRWNSWDALRSPLAIAHDILDYLRHPFATNQPTSFFLVMAVFVFCSYLILYSFRHAPLVEAASPPGPPEPKG